MGRLPNLRQVNPGPPARVDEPSRKRTRAHASARSSAPVENGPGDPAVGPAPAPAVAPAPAPSVAPAPAIVVKRAIAPAVVTQAQPAGPAGELASAIYIAGGSGLEPGGRYLIRLDGDRLRLLGPIDRDPKVVAIEFSVAAADASVTGDRLLITQRGGRSASVLAFMQLVGMTPDALASAIVSAAQEANRR